MQNPPLTEFSKKCVALLNTAPRTHATHCFRSALHHLERAEALLAVDQSMAVFRAITAEEEAASGVMRCLAEMGYPGGDQLNPHNHAQKHAVFPFLEIVELFFGQTQFNHFQGYKLHIKEEEKEGETRLMLAVKISMNGEPTLAYPIPPLNFWVRDAAGEPENFATQIGQLVTARGKASVKVFLKEEANLRNQLLYAGPDGYPEVKELSASYLIQRRSRVLAMINLYLLIYPYPDHQPFVTQALSVFLSLVRQLRRERRPSCQTFGVT